MIISALITAIKCALFYEVSKAMGIDAAGGVAAKHMLIESRDRIHYPRQMFTCALNTQPGSHTPYTSTALHGATQQQWGSQICRHGRCYQYT